jgi:hypothetical protein
MATTGFSVYVHLQVAYSCSTGQITSKLPRGYFQNPRTSLLVPCLVPVLLTPLFSSNHHIHKMTCSLHILIMHPTRKNPSRLVYHNLDAADWNWTRSVHSCALSLQAYRQF